jgi:molybdopterin converting factor subunit 1
MRVRVRLFASYAEAAGRDELDLELPAGATAADCLAAVRAEAWAERLPPAPALAVNRRYVKGDAPLHEGDEVALIPPVAGG